MFQHSNGKVPMGFDPVLSIGLTLGNLGICGKTNVGLAKGKIYRLQGRSQSGKTFVARTILAEAARSKVFDEYELIYDDVERGALMDTEKYYGRKLVERLVPPDGTPDDPMYSVTVGDFFKRINFLLAQGKKLIWIEDSLDSLEPDNATKMGDGKAKVYSQELRRLLKPLDETGSILILISQVRMDIRSPWGGDLASGGMAPEFYSTLEIVLRKLKPIKKKYKDVDYITGSLVSCRIKKNRISGRDRLIKFPFDPEVGIDDVGANVDFLLASNHWKKNKAAKVIQAPEFNFTGGRSALVKKIEEEGVERELQILVGKVWREIDEALTVGRKNRYE